MVFILGLLFKGFNPRARDGRELEDLFIEALKAVSIHAPVMDAKTILGLMLFLSCFNPRARDGREFIILMVYAPFGVSIHAPVMDANKQLFLCSKRK